MLERIFEMVRTMNGDEIQKKNILSAIVDLEKEIVKKAVEILSYHELRGMQAVFADRETEKIFNAKDIATTNGITRSQLVNAMDKLQTAGLVSAKSLGCKGTFVKVLNPTLFEILEKVA